MTILFQGDSITDARRQNRQKPNVNEQASMGNGYASMAAAALLTSRPELNLSIYSRGISGNKSPPARCPLAKRVPRLQTRCAQYSDRSQ